MVHSVSAGGCYLKDLSLVIGDNSHNTGDRFPIQSRSRPPVSDQVGGRGWI